MAKSRNSGSVAGKKTNTSVKKEKIRLDKNFVTKRGYYGNVK